LLKKKKRKKKRKKKEKKMPKKEKDFDRQKKVFKSMIEKDPLNGYCCECGAKGYCH